MITITVDKTGLDNDIKIFPEVLSRIVELIAENLKEETKNESPKRTGKLSESWEITKQDDLTWGMSSDVWYRWLAMGTKAHELSPKGNFLTVYADGEWLVRRHASHPGTADNRYLDRAIEMTESKMEQFKDQALGERYGY